MKMDYELAYWEEVDGGDTISEGVGHGRRQIHCDDPRWKCPNRSKVDPNQNIVLLASVSHALGLRINNYGYI